MMRMIFMLGVLLVATVTMVGQTSKDRLASEYYTSGEYEKAAILYKKLWDENNRRNNYYDRYITCLIQSAQYDVARKEVTQRLKNEPQNVALYVKQAAIYTAEGFPERADDLYKKALEEMPADARSIYALGGAFQQQRNYKLALQTYEKGATMIGDTLRFAGQLRSLAQAENDKPRVIHYSLVSLKQKGRQASGVKNQLQRFLKIEDHEAFQAQLYQFIQKYPEITTYPEMLEWSFIQQRDFTSALRQARALDRSMNENGNRVYSLASIASNHGDYDTAIKALEYIINKKSKSSPYYLAASSDLLRVKRSKVMAGEATPGMLDTIEASYYEFFDNYGLTPDVAYVLLDLARFQNTYQKDEAKAIKSLQELIAMRGVNKRVLANAKMDLGDLYLLQGERWEATLLYAQVDKDFPEDELGEDARYRNALLSYYVGDFEWAQEQFDILKASTTKLIANDAIDRSVFIMDNLGLDTTAHPLMVYADSELKIFQRRYEEAFDQLTVLSNLYDGHGLIDDILYLEANAYVELKEYETAADLYARVASEFPEDIRADNSIYALARLYEKEFDDLNRAANLYEKLFIDYKDSTFAVDARKRYRELLKLIPEDERKEASAEELFMRGATGKLIN